MVGFEPPVHGVKTRGYCYHELSGFHNPLKYSYPSHASYKLSGKLLKLVSKVLSKIYGVAFVKIGLISKIGFVDFFILRK